MSDLPEVTRAPIMPKGLQWTPCDLLPMEDIATIEKWPSHVKDTLSEWIFYSDNEHVYSIAVDLPRTKKDPERRRICHMHILVKKDFLHDGDTQATPDRPIWLFRSFLQSRNTAVRAESFQNVEDAIETFEGEVAMRQQTYIRKATKEAYPPLSWKDTARDFLETPEYAEFSQYAVSPALPPAYRDEYVLYQDDPANDATIESTRCTCINVEKNANKFYLMQILRAKSQDDPSVAPFLLLKVYGRIGETGKPIVETYDDLNMARFILRAHFLSKTRVPWSRRHEVLTPIQDDTYSFLEDNFEAIRQKHQIAYDASHAGTKAADKPDAKRSAITKDVLPARVAQLIATIFDLGSMQDALEDMGIDVEKFPVGSLTPATITQAVQLLGQLETVFERKDRGFYEKSEALKEQQAVPVIRTKDIERGGDGAEDAPGNNSLSLDERAEAAFQDAKWAILNKFYRLIPHSVPRHKKIKDQLDVVDMAALHKKSELLDELQYMVTVADITKDSGRMTDPYRKYYDDLQCSLLPMDTSDPMFDIIVRLTKEGHASTHQHLQFTLDNIYNVYREEDHVRWEKNCPAAAKENTVLLWHGSRVTNYAGILKKGLLIAPPEAPVSGYMFGKGIYFADLWSKSVQYCRCYRKGEKAIMLLCDVALGQPRELLHSDYHAGNLPDGTHSTHGVGATVPDWDPETAHTVPNTNVKIPLGPQIQNPGDTGSLRYNEFIVYDLAQVRIRYAVEFTMQ